MPVPEQNRHHAKAKAQAAEQPRQPAEGRAEEISGKEQQKRNKIDQDGRKEDGARVAFHDHTVPGSGADGVFGPDEELLPDCAAAAAVVTVTAAGALPLQEHLRVARFQLPCDLYDLLHDYGVPSPGSVSCDWASSSSSETSVVITL